MAFWQTKRKGIFNVIGDAVRNGVDGSSQYANRKHAHFSIIDLNNNESVSFKAFISAFSISVDHGYDDETSEGPKERYKKASLFSYSLELDVPSHSTNEAMNNLAKFSAFERMISIGTAEVTRRRQQQEGLIYPDLGFAMANLIQNGRFRLGEAYDESGVNHEKPIYGIVKDLSFKPSLDDGFYEFDNKIIAKHYKLSVKIDLLLRSVYGIFMNGFDEYGHYTEDEITQTSDPGTYRIGEDSINLIEGITVTPELAVSVYDKASYWPFGIMVGDLVMTRSLRNTYKNLGAYEGKYYDIKSINFLDNTFSDTKYSKNKGLFLGISTTPKLGYAIETPALAEPEKYVMFKAYLGDFSYAKKPKIGDVDTNANPAGVVYDYKAGLEKEWNITVDVPSNNVEEAIKNLAKVNILFRMGINYVKSDSSALGSTQKAHCYVRLSNYIFNPEVVPYRSFYSSAQDIIDTGLKCVMDTVNFEVDVESGFYEHAGHLIPKAFKLTFNIDYVDTAKEYGVDFENDGLWPHGMDWLNIEPNADQLEPVVTPTPAPEAGVEEPVEETAPPADTPPVDEAPSPPAAPPANVPNDPPTPPAIPGTPSIPADGLA